MNKLGFLVGSLAIITGACQTSESSDSASSSEIITAIPTHISNLDQTLRGTQAAATSVAAVATETTWMAQTTAPSPLLLPTNVRVDDNITHQYRRYLLFDSIRPIYRPIFVLASESPLNDDELIIGIVANRAARAYPISILRKREIVNDKIGSLPVLVSW